MKTFRGLTGSYWHDSFLEKIEDSIWWTNHVVALKDDPEMFKYFDKNEIDKKEVIKKASEKGYYSFGFSKNSRGYSGLEFKDNFPNTIMFNFLSEYREKDDVYFLSKIPTKKLEFSLYSVNGWKKMTLDEEIHDYIVRNLAPSEIHGQKGVVKYFKGDELVGIYACKIR